MSDREGMDGYERELDDEWWECIVLRTVGGARWAHTLPREQPERVCGSEA